MRIDRHTTALLALLPAFAPASAAQASPQTAFQTTEQVSGGQEGVALLYERLARVALQSDRDPAAVAARTALLHALSRERGAALEHVEDLDATRLSDAHRRAALWVLADLGGPSQLETVLELVHGDGSPPSPALQRELEETMVVLLSRKPRAAEQLGGHLRGAGPGALAPVSIALGRTGGESSLSVLRDLLREHRDLGAVLLPQVRRVVRSLPARDHAELRSEVRRFLEDGDLQSMRAASVLAADLEDEEALPRLLQLLDFEGTPAHASALSALNRLAGQDLGRDPGQWRGWYAKELAWWDEQLPSVLAELNARSAPRVLPALGELARHPLFRRALTEEVTRALDYPDPRVREAALGTLVSLGSRLAPECVLPLLEDEDRNVADAAWTALRRMTGKDLPQDLDVWLEALANPGG